MRQPTANDPLPGTDGLTVLCRDCFAWATPDDAEACHACGSPRLVKHAEIRQLSIAHIDCDAFFASIEKRDDPTIADKPLIVGGGHRGVVSTCCYIARIYGVHSAMPMYKALEACPQAVVIRPDLAKYAAVGRQIRNLMRDVTPLVEAISIDEAFLDLGGTERLHRAPPAETLARLVARVQNEIVVTASIGLSYNKFLAKVASDLDKPRGFSIIGQREAPSFLAPRPVTTIWGVGRSLQQRLARDGIVTVGDLQTRVEPALIARYGSIGARLARFSRGEDDRQVTPERETKSISSETTFNTDLSRVHDLQPILLRQCEKVARRLKAGQFSGQVVILKLKTTDFRLLTRRVSLPAPTQLADILFRTALMLLEREIDGRTFRLLGVGVSSLHTAAAADPPDLADPEAIRRRKLEQTIDAVREKMGVDAIDRGHGGRI